jgi:hypothetical protein
MARLSLIEAQLLIFLAVVHGEEEGDFQQSDTVDYPGRPATGGGLRRGRVIRAGVNAKL